MSSNDLLLGFDAREMRLDVLEDWNEERKSNFLLRRDIVKPLSNEYHLFTSVEPAAEFIHLAEEGARAHAPFLVFGIWLIK